MDLVEVTVVVLIAITALLAILLASFWRMSALRSQALWIECNLLKFNESRSVNSAEWKELEEKLKKSRHRLRPTAYTELLSSVTYELGFARGVSKGNRESREAIQKAWKDVELTFHSLHVLITGSEPWLKWKDVDPETRRIYLDLLAGTIEEHLSDQTTGSFLYVLQLREELLAAEGFRSRTFKDMIRDFSLREEWNDAVLRMEQPDESFLILGKFTVEECEQLMRRVEGGDRLGVRILEILLQRRDATAIGCVVENWFDGASARLLEAEKA